LAASFAWHAGCKTGRVRRAYLVLLAALALGQPRPSEAAARPIRATSSIAPSAPRRATPAKLARASRVAQGAEARQAKQWAVLREKMSLAQFRALLIKNVTELDYSGRLLDLGYFRPGEAYAAQDPAVFGGLVRGLVKRLLEQAQVRSLADLQRPEQIEVSQVLSSVASNDMDFILRGHTGDPKKFAFDHKSKLMVYDVFSTQFQAESVKNGGSAIEKVVIGRGGIDDPYKALEHLYRTGRFAFRLPRDKLIVHHEFAGDSRLVLLLRHLRFMHEQGMSPTAAELVAWKKLVAEEARRGLPAERQRIDRAVEKLAKTVHHRSIWVKDGRVLPWPERAAPDPGKGVHAVMKKIGLSRLLLREGYDLSAI